MALAAFAAWGSEPPPRRACVHPDKNEDPFSTMAFAVLAKARDELSTMASSSSLMTVNESAMTSSKSASAHKKPKASSTKSHPKFLPVDAEPVPSSLERELGLSDGWHFVERTRMEGASIGTRDRYYYSPIGQKFRSKREILHYLAKITEAEDAVGTGQPNAGGDREGSRPTASAPPQYAGGSSVSSSRYEALPREGSVPGELDLGPRRCTAGEAPVAQTTLFPNREKELYRNNEDGGVSDVRRAWEERQHAKTQWASTVRAAVTKRKRQSLS
mmetsp:Transcript_3533/g.10900  ORF Transcript_3533/g.10900 Transcript_3533/m.10900 type:complete len:273 (+) Transcript_3533:579-1397(+)